MRIKKTSQGVAQGYSVNGAYSESQSQAYSCDFVNNSVIESGSNTYGDYIKYIDGTLICYGTVELASTTFTTWGNMYAQAFQIDQPFPYAFIENPTLLMTPVNLGAVYETASDGTTFKRFSLMRATNTTNGFYGRYIAIGKWK